MVFVKSTIWALIVAVTAHTSVAHYDQLQRFDEYGSLPFSREVKRLDNLAWVLRRDTNKRAYVVVHQGREDHISDLKRRLCRSLSYLSAKGKIDPNRVAGAFIKGGHRRKFTIELWVFPPEASDFVPGLDPGTNDEDLQTIKGVQVKKECP